MGKDSKAASKKKYILNIPLFIKGIKFQNWLQTRINSQFVLYKVVQKKPVSAQSCAKGKLYNFIMFTEGDPMIKQNRYISEQGDIISESSRIFKIWDDEKGYLFRAKNYFVKTFTDIHLSEFVKNKTDFANLHLLAENIYKDTNMIAIKKNGNVYPAGIADIAMLIGLCERRTKSFIERMMQKGIIAKSIVNTKERIEIQYYLNPIFFMSNKYLSPHLFVLFRDQLKPFLKDWAWMALNDAANLKEIKKIKE